MICLAAQKRRSSNDPLVVSEAVTWLLETGLSVSSARIRARIKNLVGDIHIAFIGSRLLELASVSARIGSSLLVLAIAGLSYFRPRVTRGSHRKVNVYAATENSGSQVEQGRLLRSISACALPLARSIGRHERNRKGRRQADTDWVR